MSTCLAAIMGHRWKDLQQENIRLIASAAYGEVSAEHPRLISESGSAEADFSKNGHVFFRFDSFSSGYGRQILSLHHDDRWSGLLIREDTRKNFLAACDRVARFVGAPEMLILPEGTVLEDSTYEGVTFDEAKARAVAVWGPPDLDINRIYSDADLANLRPGRVHYFLISAPVCSEESAPRNF
jgi:hypothetical protein